MKFFAVQRHTVYCQAASLFRGCGHAATKHTPADFLHASLLLDCLLMVIFMLFLQVQCPLHEFERHRQHGSLHAWALTAALATRPGIESDYIMLTFRSPSCMLGNWAKRVEAAGDASGWSPESWLLPTQYFASRLRLRLTWPEHTFHALPTSEWQGGM